MSVDHKTIAVLMGGPGSEREVSIASGQSVSKALAEKGAAVIDVVLEDENFNLEDKKRIIREIKKLKESFSTNEMFYHSLSRHPRFFYNLTIQHSMCSRQHLCIFDYHFHNVLITMHLCRYLWVLM